MGEGGRRQRGESAVGMNARREAGDRGGEAKIRATGALGGGGDSGGKGWQKES